MPVINPPRIEVLDEGVSKGRITRIDFTGAGVTATVSGELATVNVPSGGAGSTSFTDFTADLGVSHRSGGFDITGLSGLTTGKNVLIFQTRQTISSKGNAQDESEMDMIIATGIVTSSTTIHVSWFSANGAVAVGTYAFAYLVGA